MSKNASAVGTGAIAFLIVALRVRGARPEWIGDLRETQDGQSETERRRH
jgi:hypothetical protein